MAVSNSTEELREDTFDAFCLLSNSACDRQAAFAPASDFMLDMAGLSFGPEEEKLLQERSAIFFSELPTDEEALEMFEKSLGLKRKRELMRLIDGSS